MSVKNRIILAILAVLLFFSPSQASTAFAETANAFTDIPKNHWAYTQANRLRELNITQGIGNNQFGLGKTISRGEFVTFLVRLMGWPMVKPAQPSFSDTDPSKLFYSSIETALLHGVIKKDSPLFRADDPITREEMAIMIVRTLGLDTLATQLNAAGQPFSDVTRNTGYITIGKDLGIVSGVGQNRFGPDTSATREQAAAMMIRMYEKLNTPLSELHAFYAISSASQLDKFSSLDSVSFGWARLEYDSSSNQVIINTDSTHNEYYTPSGFAEVMNKAESSGLSRQLMFFVKEERILDDSTSKSVSLAEWIVTHPEIRKQVISAMVERVKLTSKYGSEVSFDGVVADFEGFKGEALKLAYNTFLKELKSELDKTGKKLYVAVHPRGKPGQSYFDGYDYKTIGSLADKVILMAHDYDATSLTDAEMQNGYTDTPVTPFDEVYYALKSITDPVSGVQDIQKIWLQLSMDSVQWKLKDGKVINRIPYHPVYEQLIERFSSGVTLNYSMLSQNPYAKFSNSQDGTQNIIWYENQRSIAEKIKLAKLFGVRGLSLWRLGNIPENVDTGSKPLELNIWNEIIKNY